MITGYRENKKFVDLDLERQLVKNFLETDRNIINLLYQK